MLLYSREERLLVSLYLFACRFVNLAPISSISLKEYIRDFRENLFVKRSFVKIVQKLSRCLLEDLSTLQCIRRHCMAINALPSQEEESGCLCRKEVQILSERIEMSRITYLTVLY